MPNRIALAVLLAAAAASMGAGVHRPEQTSATEQTGKPELIDPSLLESGERSLDDMPRGEPQSPRVASVFIASPSR